METVYKIKASELDIKFIESIKALFADNEILISIVPAENAVKKTSKYSVRILNALKNLNSGNYIEIDGNEFDTFFKKYDEIMKPVRFESGAYDDFVKWSLDDKVIFKKIVDLIKAIDREAYKGIGKPELLKYELKGWWSRRINNEHRLIYKIENETISILSCKGHYTDK